MTQPKNNNQRTKPPIPLKEERKEGIEVCSPNTPEERFLQIDELSDSHLRYTLLSAKYYGLDEGQVEPHPIAQHRSKQDRGCWATFLQFVGFRKPDEEAPLIITEEQQHTP